MMKVRKGFTLVELLIVIVIIGILAAAMLLSSSSATASAEAANIISELRNLKAATMMFFADSMDAVNRGDADTVINASGSAKTLLGKYMDNPEKISDLYMFKQGTSGGAKKWFVGFDLTNATSELKEKLQGKAKSTGLLGSAGVSSLPGLTSAFEVSDKMIWVVAR
ncbi:MAG: prepilin-type N-terminal cleavage/methylation domain-containing protein [Synergistaceae bacterium]|jgi:general secretion pathway protein G|nr:prepilin-type N-terminal cleavage/methylation domain-containing protein [Synergistaceae bacterium]